LSLVAGVSLILVSHIPFLSISFFGLFILGLASIAAALFYTIGNNPYGYSGWGDLSVFIFFGLFSVLGTYFLYAKALLPDILLPAISVGALSVGVLNINNMRDYLNDKATGKNTMVVKIGVEKAKFYHLILLSLATVSSLIYLIINQNDSFGYLFLIVLLPMVMHGYRIMIIQEFVTFDKELKKLALIALFFSLIFGLGINI
jgi:1,4-dihydroxy-2-naphthoate polyprenyltransferase